jgi:hypothetical protein
MPCLGPSYELAASLLRALYSAENQEEYHLRKAALEHTVEADLLAALAAKVSGGPTQEPQYTRGDSSVPDQFKMRFCVVSEPSGGYQRYIAVILSCMHMDIPYTSIMTWFMFSKTSSPLLALQCPTPRHAFHRVWRGVASSTVAGTARGAQPCGQEMFAVRPRERTAYTASVDASVKMLDNHNARTVYSSGGGGGGATSAAASTSLCGGRHAAGSVDWTSLESEAVNCCVERDTLENELARMPSGTGGRTVQGRRRKLQEQEQEVGTAQQA